MVIIKNNIFDFFFVWKINGECSVLIYIVIFKLYMGRIHNNDLVKYLTLTFIVLGIFELWTFWALNFISSELFVFWTLFPLNFLSSGFCSILIFFDLDFFLFFFFFLDFHFFMKNQKRSKRPTKILTKESIILEVNNDSYINNSLVTS